MELNQNSIVVPKKRSPPKLAKKPIPDPVGVAKILEAGQQIKNLELRALFYVLYLSGGRISEVLKLKRGDIEQYFKENEYRLRMKIATLKNRRSHRRTLPIIARCPEERIMELFMRRYLNALPDSRAPLFQMDRHKAYYELNKLSVETDVFDQATRTSERVEYKLHPHYLRHCRLTDLANRYDMAEKDLVVFAGHSDSRTVTRYVKGSLEKYE